jgi:hypothetical protein
MELNFELAGGVYVLSKRFCSKARRFLILFYGKKGCSKRLVHFVSFMKEKWL